MSFFVYSKCEYKKIVNCVILLWETQVPKNSIMCTFFLQEKECKKIKGRVFFICGKCKYKKKPYVM